MTEETIHAAIIAAPITLWIILDITVGGSRRTHRDVRPLVERLNAEQRRYTDLLSTHHSLLLAIVDAKRTGRCQLVWTRQGEHNPDRDLVHHADPCTCGEDDAATPR